MKPKSRAQMAIRRPARVPKPQMAASRRPVAVWAASIRSGYGLLSTKPSGSRETSPGSRSRNEPWSSSWARRAGAETRKWWPHEVQTRMALSRCLLKSISAAAGTLRPHVGRVALPAGAEGQRDRHQWSSTAVPSRTARAARARRMARAIGSVGAPRVRRQATKAAPARPRAADVTAPPTRSGRRVRGARGRRGHGAGERQDACPRHRPRSRGACRRPPPRGAARGAPRSGTRDGRARARRGGGARRCAGPGPGPGPRGRRACRRSAAARSASR